MDALYGPLLSHVFTERAFIAAQSLGGTGPGAMPLLSPLGEPALEVTDAITARAITPR